MNSTNEISSENCNKENIKKTVDSLSSEVRQTWSSKGAGSGDNLPLWTKLVKFGIFIIWAFVNTHSIIRYNIRLKGKKT